MDKNGPQTLAESYKLAHSSSSFREIRDVWKMIRIEIKIDK